MLPGQAVPQFDLATALTKKETRVIRKAEYMIPYHMARCPNYGWKESEEYARAEALKEKISGIGACDARARRPTPRSRRRAARAVAPGPPGGPNQSRQPPATTADLGPRACGRAACFAEAKAKKRWEANFA